MTHTQGKKKFLQVRINEEKEKEKERPKKKSKTRKSGEKNAQDHSHDTQGNDSFKSEQMGKRTRKRDFIPLFLPVAFFFLTYLLLLFLLPSCLFFAYLSPPTLSSSCLFFQTPSHTPSSCCLFSLTCTTHKDPQQRPKGTAPSSSPCLTFLGQP